MTLHLKSWLNEHAPALSHTVAEHRTATIATASVAGAAIIGLAAYAIFRHKPTPEEIEAGRRTRLMQIGRLVDGMIIESAEELPPNTIMYTYIVAGVEYVCGQDLSPLASASIGFRTDLPVQVRYDVQNPFNSIVASEEWSGIRT